MAKRAGAVPVVCARCDARFTLTASAYERRAVRYGNTLLCSRCLTNEWLRTRGSYQAETLLRDEIRAGAE